MTPREKWYSFVPAKFEAVKYLKTRELMFLKGIRVRWLRCSNVNFFKSILNTFDVDKKDCSAYASLDHYRNIPIFTANLKRRKSETDTFDFKKELYGVDFGIDIDFKDSDYTKATSVVHDMLEKFFNPTGVKYALWATPHGYHVIIPDEEVSIYFNGDPEQKRTFYRAIAEKLKKTYEEIDLSAYMETRVFRAPYMLGNNDFVILPIKFEELKLVGNKQILLNPEYIIKNIKIMNRGVFMNGQIGNFKKFVEVVNNA
ncbi:MAG: hypothetical protein ABIJ18_05825 [archaeon]